MASIANLTELGRVMVRSFAAGDARKYEAILAWLTGQGSYHKIAAEQGINPATVLRWVRQFQAVARRTCELEKVDPRRLVQASDAPEREAAWPTALRPGLRPRSSDDAGRTQ